MPVAEHLLERWKAWKAGGAICSEMESATLFILGSIYKLRTGGVMYISGNQQVKGGGIRTKPDLSGVIETSVEALRILIRADREKKNQGA
jgi:uridine phosphorylase